MVGPFNASSAVAWIVTAKAKPHCNINAIIQFLYYQKNNGLTSQWADSWPCVCPIRQTIIGLFWTAGHDTSHECCLWPNTNLQHIPFTAMWTRINMEWKWVWLCKEVHQQNSWCIILCATKVHIKFSTRTYYLICCMRCGQSAQFDCKTIYNSLRHALRRRSCFIMLWLHPISRHSDYLVISIWTITLII